MILTVTLNPALDKTYQLPNLVPGQVNRVRKVTNIAGGKGINVARVIHAMKGEVTATGFLGGYTGQFMEQELKNRMDCKFIKVSGETRTNINVVGEDHYITELLEPGPVITDEELQLLKKRYEELLGKSSVIVLAGSVPQGLEQDCYKELTEMARKEGKKVLLDTSGEALQKGIEANPYLIKPNHKELEYVIGAKLNNTEQVIQAARTLQKRGVENILVSRGEKGFLWIGEEGNFEVTVPKVKVKSTVGCGDSLVAAIAFLLEKQEPILTMLRTAAAVSVANAMTLQNGTVSFQKVRELEGKVKIEEIFL